MVFSLINEFPRVFLDLGLKVAPPTHFYGIELDIYWVFESLLSQISLKHPVLDGDVNFTDREIMFPSQRQNYPGDRVATCDTCDNPGPEEHHQWPGADISWWHQRPGADHRPRLLNVNCCQNYDDCGPQSQGHLSDEEWVTWIILGNSLRSSRLKYKWYSTAQ